MRKLLAIWMCVALLICLAACGAASNDSIGNAAVKENFVVSDTVLTDTESSVEMALPEDRKLVQTMYIDAETEEMDPILTAVSEKVNLLGGYIEAQKTYNGSAYSGSRYRYADMTIRIPAEKLNEFVDAIGEVSNIVSSQAQIDDITLTYVATESRMKALQTEYDRLLALMEKSENLTDLLTVEQRLTEVTAELEEVTSTIRLYDNQVSYGTIHLNITEVREYTVVEEPETVWQRIGAGFMESLSDVGDFFVELFVFVTVNAPQLVIWAAVIALSIVLIRRVIKKKKARIAEKNNEG